MLNRLHATASELGGKLLEWREAGRAGIGEWQGTQFKAEADRRAHDFLVEALARIDPGLPVLSEEDETGHGTERPRRYALIDPIDGTASYANGFAGFVTQIAVMEEDRPVQAVIHAPALGLTWSAAKGHGAWCDGRRLTLGPRQDGRLALIDNYPEPRGTAALAFAALGCTAYVESGSIGLKICRVADGTADLFFKDVVVRDWDVAPAALVTAEAGGVLFGVDGQPFSFTGAMDKPGLIAAAAAVLAARAADFLKDARGKA